MVNNIKIKCPKCNYAQADVLAIINKNKIVLRCLANGRKHVYTIDPKSDTQWQKFFKPKAITDAGGILNA